MNPADSNYLIWHPFSQMQREIDLPKIVRAEGVWLHSSDGRKFFDAISSWWVNLHGHAHPYMAERVYAQFKALEHVIFAGFTHDPAIDLCERLVPYLPTGRWKFFFSDNGSTAVEVALKMGIQYLRIAQMNRKIRVIAFEGAYHGDTFGAMSAGERSVFSAPWDDLLFDVVHIPPPLPGAEHTSLHAFRNALEPASIFIYEPLVQGAAGMRMYSAEALETLLAEAKAAGCLCIADEVMTGFYRTGTFFASNQCATVPDFICLSKGLTGGALPMALTVCSQYLYDAFLDERFEKGFLHGHSFTGNPLGCAAALASLDLLESESSASSRAAIHEMYDRMLPQLACSAHLHDLRSTGSIIAANIGHEQSGYLHPVRDAVYAHALSLGLLLRPLGNVIYLLPPYVSPPELIQSTLAYWPEIAEKALQVSPPTQQR
jgi:adenosylmethionine-8-amino-7-oxononanoate aminotransferase